MADEHSTVPEEDNEQEQQEANPDETESNPVVSNKRATSNGQEHGEGGEDVEKHELSAGGGGLDENLYASLVASSASVKKKATIKAQRQRLKYGDEYDGEEGEEFEGETESDEVRAGPVYFQEEEGEEEGTSNEYEEEEEAEESLAEEEEEYIIDEEEMELAATRRAEEAEALHQKKFDLIDRYIIAKKDYKYLLKKNAYLQDKLYKICVRKGFIIENKVDDEEEKTKKKGKRKFSFNKPITLDAEEMPEGLDEEDEDAWESAMAEQNGESSRHGSISAPAGGKLKNFLEAALEAKYTRLINKIWAAEQSKLKNSVTHDMNLAKVREKSEKWDKIHQEKFLYLMDRVRDASDICLDSNTGQHLQRWETEQYIEEVSKIHGKLCKTLCKMYANRHGLEFELKRLEETEIQGEGLQMLEYEQLQAENYSLKEKLDDRLKDVDNIKGKIAHAVQILAHFRECLQKLQEKMDDGNSKLALINKRVYQVREITDVVTQRYEVFKDEEQHLISESGLLDNTKLLRDFEKTHYDVMDLKEEKRKLQKQLSVKTREVQQILSKVKDVRMNLPQLQRLQKKEEEAAAVAAAEIQQAKNSNAPAWKDPSTQDPTEVKRKNVERLQYLLEKRNLDPSKPLEKPKQFPPLADRYKCHFQRV